MLKNYLKIALRNIIRHKGYSIINMAGLAVGMACCILILLWVQDELNYDRFHENADEIYRVTQKFHLSEGQVSEVVVTSPPLAASLKEEFPEIINSTRITRISDELLLRYGNNSFYENRAFFVDSSLFDIFTFPFIKGTPETAFSSESSIVMTEEMSKKYFGDDDPMGKTLTMNNEYDFTVTGVVKDIPHNSLFRFDFFIPFERFKNFAVWYDPNNWKLNAIFTYILLPKNIEPNIVNEKISRYLDGHIENNYAELYLFPLTEHHLFNELDRILVYSFSVIAIFILIIACINFMNLATARSSNRAKEVGMRKVVGAKRIDLIKQFFSESVLFSFIALLFAIILVELVLPAFNNLTEKELTFGLFENVYMLLGLIAIALLTGIISGSYPALFLSSFQPTEVLKGSSASISGKSPLRKVLVVFQFALTIMLLIGTIFVNKQTDYMLNKNLGFDKEHMVYISLREEFKPNVESIKNELLKNPDVLGVTTSSLNMYRQGVTTTAIDWRGKNPDSQILMCIGAVDHDYIDTFKMEIIQGRDFSQKITSDASSAYIINEAAANAMGMDSPVGEQLSVWGDQGTIIGCVKNYHFESLHSEIIPLILRISPEHVLRLYIRIKPGNISNTMKYLETTWQKFIPEFPLKYNFLDETIDRLYRDEERVGIVLNLFSGMSIFISCLGLFGLVSYSIEQRTKEIGVRKVLGATVPNIVMHLTKEYAKWVLIANIFAWPVAYWAMNRWLQNFAYRANIGIATFILSATLALFIALATVSYQSIKAALANPIEALRYE
jgi:predicted permease